MSVWSTASSTLAIAIISVSCVFAIPLFAEARTSNSGSCVLGICLHILSSVLLFYEAGLWSRLSYAINLCLNRISQFEALNIPQPSEEYNWNILACLFFSGFCLSQVYNFVNSIVFAIHQPDCYSTVALVNGLSKLVLASLLIFAINTKRHVERSRVSLVIWSVVGAVCLGTAFKFVVEEVVWGYVEIVEDSISDPEYGLNITNGTTTEEYVENIFKQNARCYEHYVLKELVTYLLELIPVSTEYFALATFFCYVCWRNTAANDSRNVAQYAKNVSSSVLTLQIPEFTEEDDVYLLMDPPSEDPAPEPMTPGRANRSTFSLNNWWTAGISVSLVTFMSVSVAYLYKFMHHRNYYGGTWIFIGQQLIFQVILVLAEGSFYFQHLRGGNRENRKTPPDFQLDTVMLVFPLLPLGILFVLRVFPDLLQLEVVHVIHLVPSAPIWTLLNLFLALFNYCQVAFQAVFISEVFRRLEELRRASNFFVILAVVNICIWASWTWECKLTTIHGRSYAVYGVVRWIIIAYSTVPFIMFCFAHSAACLIGISNELRKLANRRAQALQALVDANPEVNLNQVEGSRPRSCDSDCIIVTTGALVAVADAEPPATP